MDIELAGTESAIRACYPVMSELRPHIDEDAFVRRVADQMRAGYRLAYLSGSAGPVAVAGFRIGESLAWGRHLYIDDLVTRADQRSKGHGAALLNWLVNYAAREGCAEVHLDSGMHRKDAHRFYEREGMEIVGVHIRMPVMPAKEIRRR